MLRAIRNEYSQNLGKVYTIKNIDGPEMDYNSKNGIESIFYKILWLFKD